MKKILYLAIVLVCMLSTVSCASYTEIRFDEERDVNTKAHEEDEKVITSKVDNDGTNGVNKEEEKTEEVTTDPAEEYVELLEFTMLDNGTYEVSVGRATEIKNIVIPKEYKNTPVTAVKFRGFEKCLALESIYIPEGVVSIGNSAFYGCNNLKEISIPSSIEFLGGSLPTHCLNYTVYDNVNYLGNEDNPYLCLIYPNDRTRSTYNIHPDTKIIADYAFVGMNVRNIELPSKVVSIGGGAFSQNESLETIKIPLSVKSIKNSAFIKCYGLKRIEYAGTKSQWAEIDLESGWNLAAAQYVIYCTDGEIR